MATEDKIFNKNKGKRNPVSGEVPIPRTVRLPQKLNLHLENVAMKNGIKFADVCRELLEKGLTVLEEGSLSENLVKILAKNTREVRQAKNLARANYEVAYMNMILLQTLSDLFCKVHGIPEKEVLDTNRKAVQGMDQVVQRVLRKMAKEDSLSHFLVDVEKLMPEENEDDAESGQAVSGNKKSAEES